MMVISQAHRIMANQVNEEARALLGTELAFGDRKVFLCGVFGRIAGQDMATARELMAAGLVRFARADLVSVMDPRLVADSEWDLGGATVHFVVVDPA